MRRSAVFPQTTVPAAYAARGSKSGAQPPTLVQGKLANNKKSYLADYHSQVSGGDIRYGPYRSLGSRLINSRHSIRPSMPHYTPGQTPMALTPATVWISPQRVGLPQVARRRLA